MAKEYFVGAINRVGTEPYGDNDFYGSSYFVDKRGHLVGDAGSDTEEELESLRRHAVRRDLFHTDDREPD